MARIVSRELPTNRDVRIVARLFPPSKLATLGARAVALTTVACGGLAVPCERTPHRSAVGFQNEMNLTLLVSPLYAVVLIVWQMQLVNWRAVDCDASTARVSSAIVRRLMDFTQPKAVKVTLMPFDGQNRYPNGAFPHFKNRSL